MRGARQEAPEPAVSCGSAEQAPLPGGRALPLTRRATLRAGVVGCALSVTGLATAAWGGDGGAPVVAAIYDWRFPEAEAFAGRARAKAIAPLGFAGDMTRLWFEEVSSRLRDTRRPIIGLTDARALFCFEQLAWDVGMRVRFRIDHLQQGAEVTHASATPLPAVMLAQLHAARGAFGGCAADLALGSRPVWGDCTHASPPRTATEAGDRLVTWAIAPLRSV